VPLSLTGFQVPGAVQTLNKWALGIETNLNNLNNTANTAGQSAALANASAAAISGIQKANTVYAGPATGVAEPPTFRDLVGADLPDPGPSSLGGVQSFLAVAHEWIKQISTSGVVTASQPAFTDISGNLALGQLPTAGVTAGPYTTITSITVQNGLITNITGS
jgi:hypothetical protein